MTMGKRVSLTLNSLVGVKRRRKQLPVHFVKNDICGRHNGVALGARPAKLLEHRDGSGAFGAQQMTENHGHFDFNSWPRRHALRYERHKLRTPFEPSDAKIQAIG